MKIGIIGAGFVGKAIARLAVQAGHEVMVSNSRGPKTLASVPSGTGALVGTVAEAAAFAEVVLVAIPLEHYRSVPVEPLVGKTVVDANNYYPERDGAIAALDARQTTTSAMLAEHLPASHVVKAFNAILANDLETDGRPDGAASRRGRPGCQGTGDGPGRPAWLRSPRCGQPRRQLALRTGETRLLRQAGHRAARPRVGRC